MLPSLKTFGVATFLAGALFQGLASAAPAPGELENGFRLGKRQLGPTSLESPFSLVPTVSTTIGTSVEARLGDTILCIEAWYNQFVETNGVIFLRDVSTMDRTIQLSFGDPTSKVIYTHFRSGNFGTIHDTAFTVDDVLPVPNTATNDRLLRLSIQFFPAATGSPNGYYFVTFYPYGKPIRTIKFNRVAGFATHNIYSTVIQYGVTEQNPPRLGSLISMSYNAHTGW
ncbi:hypothetical protein TWF481_007542 [Arthrobotrys musiformis]|uniref:Uncharacterized protein n=1 Tax=Arthrobotrys musiformis TaxID=47236 RepID=A0AAV9WBT8_9PEZI